MLSCFVTRRGMGMGNPNARVFRSNFGGGPPRRQQGGQQGNGGGAEVPQLASLLQFLPIILIICLSWFASELHEAVLCAACMGARLCVRYAYGMECIGAMPRCDFVCCPFSHGSWDHDNRMAHPVGLDQPHDISREACFMDMGLTCDSCVHVQARGVQPIPLTWTGTTTQTWCVAAPTTDH